MRFVSSSNNEVHVHEGEGDESADDDQGVEDVPQVATVGARVKQYSTIYDLQTSTSAHCRYRQVSKHDECEIRSTFYDLGSISTPNNGMCDDNDSNISKSSATVLERPT